ncbi:unnamed protein product [Ranitomeya imitator]|uniref:Uncharacterized protein n=1 Tax=Ranitomeya imitator TaxID=111125 RepID=A0ABN9LBM3_9NEOB|nr:unnamed protein product [Ranitomeya imitator]
MTPNERPQGSDICTSWPRPIFGSLHHVTDLSCCGWHTILIVEKVLNSKTIRSNSSGLSIGTLAQSCSSRGSTEGEGDSASESIVSEPSDGFRGTMEAEPETGPFQYHRKHGEQCELEEAEFIPMPESPAFLSMEFSQDQAPPLEEPHKKSEDVSATPEAQTCVCSSLQEEVKRLQGLVSAFMSEQESLRRDNARLAVQVQSLEERLQTAFQEGQTVSKQGEMIHVLQRQVALCMKGMSSAGGSTETSREDCDETSWCFLGTDPCRSASGTPM